MRANESVTPETRPGNQVVVVGFDIPMKSLVVLMLKVAIIAVPAMVLTLMMISIALNWVLGVAPAGAISN
jgi:hypothetical protein